MEPKEPKDAVMQQSQQKIGEDLYFLTMAIYAALRSKHPKRKVGCALRSWRGKTIGVGWNGPPPRSDDNKVFRDGIHAEENAIFHCNSVEQLERSTAYVTTFPCNFCARKLVQVGVSRVVYLEYPKEDGRYQKTEEYFRKHKVAVEYVKLELFENLDKECEDFLNGLERPQDDNWPHIEISPEEAKSYRPLFHPRQPSPNTPNHYFWLNILLGLALVLALLKK